MSDPFSIGTSALLAFQRAMATASNNVANASTPGYTRQRVEFSSRVGQGAGFGFLGAGVQISGINRLMNSFLTSRLDASASEMGRLQVLTGLASRVDRVVSEAGTSLARPMSDFFDSTQGVVAEPTSAAARQSMLDGGQNAVNRFRTQANQLTQLDQETGQRIGNTVDEVNRLTATIARLNSEIVRARGEFNQPPNDLLDQRDQAVRELSGKIGVLTFEQDDGALNVQTGSGASLVLGNQAQTLSMQPDRFRLDRQTLSVTSSLGPIPLSTTGMGGELAGLFNFRTEVIDPAMAQLGQLAVGLTERFNAQHRAGVDFNGDPGLDFFRPIAPTVLPATTNAGTANFTASVSDVGAFTGRDIILRFDGATWQARLASTGASLPMTGSGTAADPFVVEGVSLEVTGAAVAGDDIQVRTGSDAARQMAMAIADPNRIAAALPVRGSAPLTNTGSGILGPITITDAANPNLQDPVNIVFTGPGTYSINGGPGLPYTPGDTIAVNGWEVTLDGTPAPGDQFVFGPMGSRSGDNGNARLLAEIGGEGLFNGGNQSLTAGIAEMTSRFGGIARQAEYTLGAQAAIDNQLQSERDAVSGVNLDEEAANLLKFQQSYQAAAQIISIANAAFDSLLAAVRR
jgi:flagellar hook-associated protein 1 FlgK